MITEKDFDLLVFDNMEPNYGSHIYIDSEKTGKECFELAKKMAVEFIGWAIKNQYSLINTSTPDDLEGIWRWWWYGEIAAPSPKNTYTTEQLLELYLNQDKMKDEKRQPLKFGTVQSEIYNIQEGATLVIQLDSAGIFHKTEHARVASSGEWGVVLEKTENSITVKPLFSNKAFCSMGENIPAGTLMKNELIIATGRFSTSGETIS